MVEIFRRTSNLTTFNLLTSLFSFQIFLSDQASTYIIVTEYSLHQFMNKH